MSDEIPVEQLNEAYKFMGEFADSMAGIQTKIGEYSIKQAVCGCSEEETADMRDMIELSRACKAMSEGRLAEYLINKPNDKA